MQNKYIIIFIALLFISNYKIYPVENEIEIKWFGQSCFLIITSEGTQILTDPVEFKGYHMPKNIKADIVTISHNHPDHIGGNKAIKNATGAKIIMHKDDARSIMRLVAGSPKIDIMIDGDDIIKVGNISFQLIHTPGHTRGGLCYFAEGQLFTGDTLFVGDSGATSFPGGHRPTLGASLRKIMTKFPDDTIVWPGHDYGPTPSSTLGWEKHYNVNAREYGFYSED